MWERGRDRSAGFLPKRGFKPSTRQTRVSVSLEVRARTPGGVTGDARDGEVSDGSRDAHAAGDGAGDGNREGAGDGDGDGQGRGLVVVPVRNDGERVKGLMTRREGCEFTRGRKRETLARKYDAAGY